jgi:hypothetical protein
MCSAVGIYRLIPDCVIGVFPDFQKLITLPSTFLSFQFRDLYKIPMVQAGQCT